jgi:hypothetical protein
MRGGKSILFGAILEVDQAEQGETLNAQLLTLNAQVVPCRQPARGRSLDERMRNEREQARGLPMPQSAD